MEAEVGGRSRALRCAAEPGGSARRGARLRHVLSDGCSLRRARPRSVEAWHPDPATTCGLPVSWDLFLNLSPQQPPALNRSSACRPGVFYDISSLYVYGISDARSMTWWQAINLLIPGRLFWKIPHEFWNRACMSFPRTRVFVATHTRFRVFRFVVGEKIGPLRHSVSLFSHIFCDGGCPMSMIRRVRLAGVLFSLLAAVAMTGIAVAQTSNGTLVGAVTDQTGAVVPKVDVKVESAQYGQVHEATTDSVGTYRIEGLQPGVYSVTFTSTGLAALRVGNVAINGSVTTTVDGQLQLGSIQSSVTVEAGANQMIDTQSGQLGESLTTRDIESLPYGSFNAAELAMTLPGVQDVPAGQGAVNASFTNGIGYSVNGTRPRANSFLIDGQDDNDYGIAGQAYQVDNLGLVQNFTILTNSYSAQYGRGGGSVGNYITKSGSNAFHGEAWEVNQDSYFAANDAANKLIGVTRPLYIENTFGFDVGGPLIKDKLFIFGTAQWDRTRQRGDGTTYLLPDAAGIATLQALPSTTNAALFLASLGGLVAPNPTATNPAVPMALGNDPMGVPRPAVEMTLFARNGVPIAGNDRNWDVRLDWHMGPNDTLTGSYLRDDSALSPDFFANGGALPPFDTEQGGPSQVFAVCGLTSLGRSS